MHIVELGQLADRLLAPQGRLGVVEAAGEHLKVAYPALDVAGGELVRAALRLEDDSHVRVVRGDAVQDLLVAGAQRRQAGQLLRDFPQAVGQHRGHPHGVDELPADEAGCRDRVGRAYRALPGLPGIRVKVARRADVAAMVEDRGVVELMALLAPPPQGPGDRLEQSGRVQCRCLLREPYERRNGQAVLDVVLPPVDRASMLAKGVSTDMFRLRWRSSSRVRLREPAARPLGYLGVDHDRVDAHHVASLRGGILPNHGGCAIAT